MVACRICKQSQKGQGELITPCHCKDPIVKFCHQECLASLIRDGKPTRCDFCGFKYIYKAKMRPLTRLKLPVGLPRLLAVSLTMMVVLLTTLFFVVTRILAPFIISLLIKQDSGCSVIYIDQGDGVAALMYVIVGAFAVPFVLFETKFATIATLLECFMRNRDIIVENLGNAPTPVDQLEKLEEGLAQADNQDDANNNNQICTRYEKESHPKCSICKKGAKFHWALNQVCHCKKLFHHNCLLRRIMLTYKDNTCQACGFQFVVITRERTQHIHWSYSLTGFLCASIPIMVAFVLALASLIIMGLVKPRCVHSLSLTPVASPQMLLGCIGWALLEYGYGAIVFMPFSFFYISIRDNTFTIIQEASGKKYIYFRFYNGFYEWLGMYIDSASAKRILEVNKSDDEELLESDTIFDPLGKRWSFPEPK